MTGGESVMLNNDIITDLMRVFAEVQRSRGKTFID